MGDGLFQFIFIKQENRAVESLAPELTCVLAEVIVNSRIPLRFLTYGNNSGYDVSLMGLPITPQLILITC